MTKNKGGFVLGASSAGLQQPSQLCCLRLNQAKNYAMTSRRK